MVRTACESNRSRNRSQGDAELNQASHLVLHCGFGGEAECPSLEKLTRNKYLKEVLQPRLLSSPERQPPSGSAAIIASESADQGSAA